MRPSTDVCNFDEEHKLPDITRPTSFQTPARRMAHHQTTSEENTLLLLAAAVESKSEHPLAQAIVGVETAMERGIKPCRKWTQFQSSPARGVSRVAVAFMGGIEFAIGSPRYFGRKWNWQRPTGRAR